MRFKRSKNWDFSKGVHPWFWSKNCHFVGIFPTFLITQYRLEKCLLWYSRTKNAFLGYKKKKLRKSKNWHFSKGVNLWFWSKNGHFSNFFIRQYRLGKCLLTYSLERKNGFLGYKKKKLKKSKHWHFSKGVNLWFWSKNGHFSKFFFRHYKPGKCLLWYSRTKKRFSRL